MLRQSLSQHATVSANLLEELSLNLDLLDIKDKVYCDASTQTNLETKVIPAKTTPVYANVDSYESNEDSDLSLEEIQICLPLDDTSKVYCFSLIILLLIIIFFSLITVDGRVEAQISPTTSTGKGISAASFVAYRKSVQLEANNSGHFDSVVEFQIKSIP